MDAMLWELLAGGAPDDQVEVLIKLSELGKFPSGPIEVVAQIGNILSCRIKRGDIKAVRSDAAVWSMKASKNLHLDLPIRETFSNDLHNLHSKNNIRRPRNFRFTGKKTAIGVADWGIDFTHANFLNKDGTTRFIALWDQSAAYDGINEYGYGAIHSREQINDALSSDEPFRELNYHPGIQDIFQEGMHGTHVLDIAAGNGAVGFSGVAPEADLIGVHLSTGSPNDLMGLGTSARVFNAIHFLDAAAGNIPLVINLSMGGHCDAHAGRSLIEQAIDYLTSSQKGRAVVQSCGNYFGSRTHTAGFVRNRERRKINWLIFQNTTTSNEIEIWYKPDAIIKISLITPSGEMVLRNEVLGRKIIYEKKAGEIGRYYHRENEPNTKLNQIEIILDGTASKGEWQILLTSDYPQEIKYHAWIERNDGSSSDQSRFTVRDASSFTTTGSICNGFYTIAVGAIGMMNKEIRIGSFSSVGPTWDGRQKPDLTAPGVQILAAKSASAFEKRSSDALTLKTGTSMAAPFVAGAIALLYEASKRPLSIEEVKQKLFKACERVKGVDGGENNRYGIGHLKIENLFAGSFDFQSEDFSVNNKKRTNMEYPDSINYPVESLLEIAENQFPDLNSNHLPEYFDALPSLPYKSANSDLKRGDVLIRRQYGHINKAWHGVVEFVHDNEIFLLTRKGIKKITSSIEKWEWKTLRPDYSILNDHLSRRIHEEPFSTENYFDEDFYGEDADTAVTNLTTLRNNAAKNKINTIYQRTSAATCLKHPGLPNNPLIGVTDEMIKACFNTYYMHGALSKPEILMAFWKKEGSDKQKIVRAVGSAGIRASSPENAVTIFRTNTYYIEMGMDVLTHFKASPGKDNIVQIDDSTVGDHDAAFTAKVNELVKNKYLGRNLVTDINSNLKVNKMDTGIYSVTPTTHFYIYNLLVMDALLRYHEDQLKKVPDYGGVADIALVYMHWNMRQASFLEFIKSANNHRRETKYLSGGTAISLTEWAFHTCPVNGEFDQSRSNAIKVKYFSEVFALLFENTGDNILSESSYGSPALSEDFADAYEEDTMTRKGSKSDSAKLTWVTETASGDNPDNRVYYVVTGAAGNKGAYIELNIKNTNSHYNLKGLYLAIILQWAKNNGGNPIADNSTVIPLDNKKSDRKFIQPTGSDELEDGTERSFKINLKPEDLKKAYQLLDKSNFEIQVELFCYWHEGVATYDYYYNSIKKHFFLVQPLELVDTGEIVDWSFGPDFENIKTVLVTKKNGTTKNIEYPQLYNSYEKPIRFLSGAGETDSVSVGIVNIDSQTITSTIKNTQTNSQDETFKFNIGGEFVEDGLKTIVGLGYENKVSQSLSKEISLSLSDTRTYQESVGISKSITIPPTDEPRQFFAKLVFAPVVVKGFRYTQVNEKGIAGHREIIKDPFLIWVPKVWAIYYKKTVSTQKTKPRTITNPRTLRESEAWEEGKPTPPTLIGYKPLDEQSLVINMQEFPTHIKDFHNYKNNAVPHNTVSKRSRQASEIKFILLHETSGNPLGTAFEVPKCIQWSSDHPAVCTAYKDATAHLAVIMEKNSVNGQPDLAVAHQFNDLCEIEYHATVFNKTAVGIEFSNRDWEEGKGIKKNNIPDRLAENKGYLHAYWGDGYNIYKWPLLEQLEKLVELLLVLINKNDDGFPKIDHKWLQVVSYNDVKDYFEFSQNDIPATDDDKADTRFFIYTNATDYMVPDNFPLITGILSHGSVSNVNADRFIDENAHTDGSFQALFTWLRIAKSYNKDTAYAKAKDLLHNPPIIAKTKTKVHWKDDGLKTGKRNIYLFNIQNI